METIQNALEKLPVKFREIILLCDLEEMSYQEIGQTLGIPIGTVMSRLSRARKAMRELLAAKSTGGIVMTCDPWRDKLDAYVDGDTSQGEIAGMERAFADVPVLRRRCAQPLADEAHDASSCGARYSPSPEFRLRMEKSIQKNARSNRKPGLGICLDAEAGCASPRLC